MNGHLIHSSLKIADRVHELWVEAPRIANKHRAGQFVILRLHEHGERIPLTVVETDPVHGLIRLIVQEAGKSTTEMAGLSRGDYILDVVGPLGEQTHLENWNRLLVIGGGVGCAPLLPITKAAKALGNQVYAIIGTRSRQLMILENEFREVCDHVRVCTDDGTQGEQGLVTNILENWAVTERFNFGIVIGPVPMMKATSAVLKKLNIPAIASLNPIMVDGTGMCGACRVTVHGQVRFACVEGPEFDAHGVDFDELLMRNRSYLAMEKISSDHMESEKCRLKESMAKSYA